jgi:hypothetical protein
MLFSCLPVAIWDDLTGHFTPPAQITRQRLRALAAMSIPAAQLGSVGAGKSSDPIGTSAPLGLTISVP